MEVKAGKKLCFRFLYRQLLERERLKRAVGEVEQADGLKDLGKGWMYVRC